MLNIYKLYDDKDNLLYIGKTKNIHQRIIKHLSEKDSISWKADIHKIIIADINSDVDLELYETYLINKLKPRYNSSKVYKDDTKLILDELNFYEYKIRDTKSKIYKYSDRVLGFCYKLYLFKGFTTFKQKDIILKFDISESTFKRLISDCVNLKLIEKLERGNYKLSNDFILE